MTKQDYDKIYNDFGIRYTNVPTIEIINAHISPFSWRPMGSEDSEYIHKLIWANIYFRRVFLDSEFYKSESYKRKRR